MAPVTPGTPETPGKNDPRLVLDRVKTVPGEVFEGGEIPIRTEDGRRVGALVPITREVAREPGVAALLTRWREANKRFFFTQFATSEERTALWLERGIFGDAGRVLFFICDENGARLGHYGLTGVREGHAELDNLIRGERGGDRRLVYYAEVALLAFAFERLGAEAVMLRAFANNVLATAVHDEIGFLREHNEPLVKEEGPEGVAWKPAPPGATPERELVVMRLDRERFAERFAWATAKKDTPQEGVPRGGAGAAKGAVHSAMYSEETPMSQTPKSFDEECAEYVARMAADEEVRQKTLDWINTTARHKYTYNFRWMGRPLIQFPQDLVAMQELVWSVKPDIIIETGVAHGGSLIFYASLLELLGGDGLVVGVDIDIRAHNRKAIEEHPMFRRIRLLQGSSIDPQVVNEVRELARGRKRILVALDSNHTHEHVLSEMRAYAPLVTRGSYLIVFDTIIEDMPADSFPDRPWGKGNNPKTAVWEYLKASDRFVIDETIPNKLQITVAPDGYLKCVKD